MGTLASVTSIEVAGQKARAAAFNNAMTEIFGVLNDGSREIYSNTYRNNRASNGNMTITGSDCMFFGFHEIGTATTYDLATSTARGVCFDSLVVHTNGVLDLATNAVFRIV